MPRTTKIGHQRLVPWLHQSCICRALCVGQAEAAWPSVRLFQCSMARTSVLDRTFSLSRETLFGPDFSVRDAAGKFCMACQAKDLSTTLCRTQAVYGVVTKCVKRVMVQTMHFRQTTASISTTTGKGRKNLFSKESRTRAAEG